ncbi:unnamed protein product [Heterosigma akashiwo]|eukprot:CAMPEP_0194581522 /NCGR_PEP_ID=MMETSP0292-20121207/14958_1 /TAXON_ID=39354 /ORGANISM="Heterosigma akashiwo, Strain CCMP2393" /LENGTH=93 /DNA_ID=CAMNT_0039435297 /DNA_START=66 /DNA_END=347 /DNA_ORIENTATION=-
MASLAVRSLAQQTTKVAAGARFAAGTMRQQNRTFVKKTMPRLGGDGDHHVHHVFSPPFNKGSTAVLVFGGLIFGVSAVWGSFVHQNKKHGFSK